MHAFGAVPDTIIGATDRWFVVDGRAIALDGSQTRDLPPRCGLSTLTQVARDDTLVFETSGPSCSRRLYEVTALDLETGVTRLVWSMPNFKVTFDPALVPSEEHVSVPAGDVLLAPSNIAAQADSGPGLLLSVADGTTTQLPPWPEVPAAAP